MTTNTDPVMRSGPHEPATRRRSEDSGAWEALLAARFDVTTGL
jgi:hypothetical protein